MTDDDLRARIGVKGMEVAQRLAALKAGQDVDLATMDPGGLARVGQTKEERLRAWLDAINRARTRVGTPQWGYCVRCGDVIDPAALSERPWVEECGSHD